MTGRPAPPAPAKPGLADRLGVPRHRYAARYGVSGLIRATATGLFYPFSLLYFHHQLGASLVQIGTCLAVAGLAGSLGVVGTGRLVDRFGARNVMAAAALTRMSIFAGYPLVHDLRVFAILASLMALAFRTDQVAGQAMASALAPPGASSSWLALSRTTLNAGMGIGALIGGLLLVSPSRYTWLVLANAASFAVVAGLTLTLPSVVARTAGAPSTTGVWRDRLFVGVALLGGLWLVVGLAVEVGLPVYLVLYLHASPVLVSMVFVVNTALVSLLQLPVTRQIRDRPVMRMFAVGVATYAATFLILLGAGGTTGALLVGSLLAAVCAFSVGEMVVAVTTMMVVNQLAPPDRLGAYVGVSHLFAGLGSAAAPLLFTAGLALSPAGLWAGLAGLAVVMTGLSLRMQVPVRQRMDQVAGAPAQAESASTSTSTA